MKKAFIFSTITLIVFTVICMISGCSNPKPKPEPPLKKARSLISYATPWDWASQDSKQFARELYKNGLTMTIIEIDFKRDADFVAKWIKPFRDLGITTEIILVNWNTKSVISRPTSDFKKLVDELKVKVGSYLVIWQPVTEPGNRGGDRKKCEEWMKYGYDNLPGLKSICIKDSWWGQQYKNKANYYEKHLCKEADDKTIYKGSNKISTNDCTPLIGASPNTLYKQAKLYIKYNQNWSAYHSDWNGPVKFDVERIKAIGRAIAES